MMYKKNHKTRPFIGKKCWYC